MDWVKSKVVIDAEGRTSEGNQNDLENDDGKDDSSKEIVIEDSLKDVDLN